MRLPRFRVTIRRMMVAVAIVGMCLGCGVWIQKLRRASESYRVRAILHTSSAARLIRYNHQHGGLEKHVAYDLKMRAKYMRASLYPWLPVEPDPPKPE